MDSSKHEYSGSAEKTDEPEQTQKLAAIFPNDGQRSTRTQDQDRRRCRHIRRKQQRRVAWQVDADELEMEREA